MALTIGVANHQWPPRPQRCSSGGGPKFKLLHEGDIQVCRLNHSRTLISKVLSSKFLRRWEAHHISLGDFQMYSSTYSSGFMDTPVPYHEIQDVYTVNRWDTGQHFCIRITIPDGSVLLRATNAYLRDQWLHSIKWKVNLQRYKKLLSKTNDHESLTRELKDLVLFSLTTPLQDDVVFTVPVRIVSDILANVSFLLHCETFGEAAQKKLIVHCKGQPQYFIVLDMFLPAVHRILKHNMDFGKLPHLRMFVQDYIFTLYSKNESASDVQEFVNSMHSPGAVCPHPRVLPNLVAVVLAAVYSTFDQPEMLIQVTEINTRFLLCFMTVLDTCAQYEDWRPSLANLLQPIPFPKQYISGVIKLFAEDKRCEVHQSILPVRKGKDGWIDMFCPGGISCFDEGHFFSLIMTMFLNCCGKRKKMLSELKETVIGPFMLLALRGDVPFINALTFMLEVEMLDDENEKLQIVSTLESTDEGRESYETLCQKRTKFREMIEKGGPTVLTLPTKSTGKGTTYRGMGTTYRGMGTTYRGMGTTYRGWVPLIGVWVPLIGVWVPLIGVWVPLIGGSTTYWGKGTTYRGKGTTYRGMGTTYRGKGATYRGMGTTYRGKGTTYRGMGTTYWGKGTVHLLEGGILLFDDLGLQMVAEHLHHLETLNLCETPVTDVGLSCLVVMTSLRYLNLNSTKLSPALYERLKVSSKQPDRLQQSIPFTKLCQEELKFH
ncbi:hypothetical protein QZH41_010719 [Actinostola sp. cb2023]|nr:hypothetical protein QZH41_010719 [Actinostola sp. cb2023]